MIKRLFIALLYNLLLIPGLLFACYKLYWPREGKTPFGKRAVEHFGFGGRVSRPDVWLHAVSVGEVIACVPLVKALLKEHPNWCVLVTTTSATGAQEVKRRLGDTVIHRYSPFDLLPCISLFLLKNRPKQLWIMETELWLNWLLLCRWLHIPVKLINARLSNRSAERYQRFASFAQMLLSRISWIGAQYDHDRANFIRCGAAPAHVQAIGSIKYDLNLDPQRIKQARQIRQAQWQARKTLIAISTHRGEDQIMLDIAAKLRDTFADLLLIIVPRHPERFDDVAKLIEAQANMARRSQNQPVNAQTQVYLADTMGELIDLLAMSDIAIMGGTFDNIGGHNYLEPAALGLPCVSGPHDFNFQEISQQLQQAQALVLNQNIETLIAQLTLWFNDRQCYHAASQAALKTVQANQGATARTLHALVFDMES
ncbi:lipid IV(A) 3-deoxy-D-manno-octulosonic acid transferase [Celerinatantimonas diazotrophica]|uniref:3-deoxy-D-manno-octulosonic acid transferase n=1 Tax=Celerinatantimonas diazotrophica TaxID=412034 RepID=A0A4R1J7K7_9GAMM|nr:lipid IV(A) 3-deoxy-D-manno-octulosonic acid transferase [Celerinatantimonas diazotrophica]TCK46367.1 3-deoxy-D-manno-octulosonic-acid transferase [Celerinatantimonas diazotrophica]CAG9295259.1 3-deoxy-D-manno-octulosonic acid transferase [Celerinatantimonas diazotrophica]